MTPTERLGLLAHARTRRFMQRLEQAHRCVAAALASTSAPYVAFSAGKDSSALLSLALEHRPDIEARLLSSGETRLLHGNLDTVLAWWREHYPALRLTEINVDRVFSPEWAEASWQEQRKAGKGDMERFLTGDVDGVLMGLRAEESNRRRIALSRRVDGLALRRVEGGRLHAYPLADWTTKDVGALLARRGIPLLDAYAVEGLEARTTARLTGDAARQGALAALRRRDKAAYAALVTRFPELAEIGGYAG